MAKQDEDWNLLATPLHEENHPLGRSLEVCPNCGASLTSDDRTFNGSYCENCRTRWIQSA
jgi:predicted amidophosphoribosyltransferase